MPRSKGKKRKQQQAEENLLSSDSVEPPVKQLQVSINNSLLSFTEFTRWFTRHYYPDVMSRAIMVPPLTFHQHWKNVDEVSTKKLTDSLGKQQIIVRKVDESSQRASEAEYRVTFTFQRFANERGWRMAIITGTRFENYLDKIKDKFGCPPRPADLGSKYERGEHDLLLVYPVFGVIIVSVKSTGANFEELGFSEEKQSNIVLTKLREAVQQLKKEVKAAKHVLSDLSPQVPVHAALALPNVGRQDLIDVLQQTDDGFKKELDNVFGGQSDSFCLCRDELPRTNGQCSEGKPEPSTDEKDTAEAATTVGSLEDWFRRRFPTTPHSPVISDDQYLDVIGRYCGLLSTVEIPHRRCEGRIEVRSMSEAVAEVSRRFQAFILLPFQADLLLSGQRRLYMFGMVGSGKTVMLILKSRLWLVAGIDVIIVNISYDVEGSPIGHALLEAINCEGSPRKESRKKAKLINLRLAEFEKTLFLSNLRSLVGDNAPRTPMSFCCDEVYAGFQPVFDAILEAFPNAEIWAAGLEEDNAPANFTLVEMREMLRCPPSIQRVLKATEYEEKSFRREWYTTSGACSGLAAEGPLPRFILHQHHSLSAEASPSSSAMSSTERVVSKSPLQCAACAQEVIRVFSEILGFRAQKSESDAKMEAGTSSQHTESTAAEAAISPPLAGQGSTSALSLKDIAILCKDTGSKVYAKVGSVYMLDEKLHGDFMNELDNSIYLKTLRENGFSVRVVRSPSSGELASSANDVIKASWINPASGLEWAVVIYIPGDPPEEHHSEATERTHQMDCTDKGLQAVFSRMTSRDREYLYWAASRSTGFLIVHVP